MVVVAFNIIITSILYRNVPVKVFKSFGKVIPQCPRNVLRTFLSEVILQCSRNVLETFFGQGYSRMF